MQTEEEREEERLAIEKEALLRWGEQDVGTEGSETGLTGTGEAGEAVVATSGLLGKSAQHSPTTVLRILRALLGSAAAQAEVHLSIHCL
jgi:hypothetical protein